MLTISPPQSKQKAPFLEPAREPDRAASSGALKHLDYDAGLKSLSPDYQPDYDSQLRVLEPKAGVQGSKPQPPVLGVSPVSGSQASCALLNRREQMRLNRAYDGYHARLDAWKSAQGKIVLQNGLEMAQAFHRLGNITGWDHDGMASMGAGSLGTALTILGLIPGLGSGISKLAGVASLIVGLISASDSASGLKEALNAGSGRLLAEVKRGGRISAMMMADISAVSAARSTWARQIRDGAVKGIGKGGSECLNTAIAKLSGGKTPNALVRTLSWVTIYERLTRAYLMSNITRKGGEFTGTNKQAWDKVKAARPDLSFENLGNELLVSQAEGLITRFGLKLARPINTHTFRPGFRSYMVHVRVANMKRLRRQLLAGRDVKDWDARYGHMSETKLAMQPVRLEFIAGNGAVRGTRTFKEALLQYGSAARLLTTGEGADIKRVPLGD